MKILLPFHHDTSLIFATRFERQLREAGHNVALVELVEADGNERISHRQRVTYLPDRDVPAVDIKHAGQPDFYDGYDAVAVCVPVAPLRQLLRRRWYMARKSRPRFIAFFPGMEFTPHIGMRGRRDFDAIFLNHADHEALYREHFMRPGQFVYWGHPYFTLPERFIDVSDCRKDVYFFAQAVSPTTKRARMHIVEILAGIAKANPDRRVVIKLRHLASENNYHVHKEQWGYEELVNEAAYVSLPNLVCEAGTAEMALLRAGYCINCTSTVAMDATSAGIPTAIYLGYPDFWKDPLVVGMHSVFQKSRLVKSATSIMRLEQALPDRNWIAANFRHRGDVVAQCTKFIENNVI